MRTTRTLVGSFALAVSLAGCGAPRGPALSGGPASPPVRPPILRAEPACTYRVLGEIAVRAVTTSVPDREITSRARGMGAYAVIFLSHTPEYQNGRPAGSTWIGHAITFSDPADPDCYGDR